MRAFLLLVIVAGMWAADEERFTLKDGRVLVGTYDEDHKTLSFVVGGIPGKARLEPEQIVKREALSGPPPDKNFVEEAKQLDLQQKAVSERRERERIAREAAEKEEADRLSQEIAQAKVEAARRAQLEEAERRAAAKRAAEFEAHRIEQEKTRIQQEKLDAAFREEDHKRIEENEKAKLAVYPDFSAEAARRVADQERVKQQRLRDLDRISAERNVPEVHQQWRIDTGYVTAAIAVFGLIVLLFYFWFWPYRIAKERDFKKKSDVRMILIVCLFLPGIGFMGWFAILLWVLIASPPPSDHAR